MEKIGVAVSDFDSSRSRDVCQAKTVNGVREVSESLFRLAITVRFSYNEAIGYAGPERLKGGETVEPIVQNNAVQKLWDVLELTLWAAKKYEIPDQCKR